MKDYARLAPGRATVCAVGVAVVAMAGRNAWPTPAEVAVLGATVVCLFGALRSGAARRRILFAGAWVVPVLASAIMIDPPQVWLDLKVFFDAAERMFDQRQSPYSVEGAFRFPFPTYVFIRALSGWGRVSFQTTAWLMFASQLAGLGLSFLLVRAIVRREPMAFSPDTSIGVIQGSLLLHPTTLFVLYYGQPVIAASTLLIGALWCWRCGRGRWRSHGSAILLNLSWMLTPQLLMAVAFFFVSWLRERWLDRRRTSEAAAIGGLLGPWGVALLVLSVPLAFPAHLTAYRDFVPMAVHAHTYVAEMSPNNYALSAIVAKTGLRLTGLPVALTLPFLTAVVAGLLLLWNLRSLRDARKDSLVAFLPWLLASILWTSYLWRFYFSLVLAGLLLLVAYRRTDPVIESRVHSVWLAAGIGLTMVLSSFAFTLGILVLYFYSHAVLARDTGLLGRAGA